MWCKCSRIPLSRIKKIENVVIQFCFFIIDMQKSETSYIYIFILKYLSELILMSDFWFVVDILNVSFPRI